MQSNKLRTLTLMLGAVGIVALSGCLSNPVASTPKPAAVAEIAPTQGNTVKGTVEFAPQGDKVLVTATLSGLAPNSTHGFHIHEKGDCSAPDGTSAGGHFNPDKVQHGQGEIRHVGDMPNIKADAKGNATYSEALDLLSLDAASPNYIVERGVIVHQNPDDYVSQPVGNAGARLACGVITAVK
ncbi:MAG: superoxide dismutase family protein [Azoarcus sp.]|jgi:Cu-Zn family superoxide dismutase|nr:superoxide dismutase family protein [Azoarcus sp.]